MTAKPTQDKPKSSKKRRHEEEDDDPTPSKEAKKDKKSKEKKHRTDKAAKKKAKEALLAKIPTHDEDGIPYNKIQIRRMKRRVKNGLNPIPTEEEEREIEKRKEEEKREVEACLFADRDDNKNGSDEEEDGDDEKDDRSEDIEEENNEDDNESKADDESEPIETHQPPPRPNKKSRTKPVPTDYICSACQNKPKNGQFTPHWIYDCPSKITKRGCNTKSKKLRGLHDPASRKVFVSGLPFDVTERGVKEYFEKENNVEVVHVKLLKFEDSQRCKGQGILTFDTDEGARDALKMNGYIWSGEEEGSGKKKKKKVEKKEGKELRLKVTKVLNRFVTKKQKKG